MVGIQSRSLWSPPPSPPKPATDSSLAEKPFLGPFLACDGLRFPVSARRHRLQAPFGAPVSGGENPVPNSPFLGSRPWFPALILVLPLALPPARGQHNFQPKASCPSLSRRADIRLTVLA